MSDDGLGLLTEVSLLPPEQVQDAGCRPRRIRGIGFLVEDLDSAYGRALDAGATDVHRATDSPGIPKNAQLKDPSGNHIGLYQG